jgi:hypothetical protein
MSRRRSLKPDHSAPAKAEDDFQLVKGIGPAIERHLRAAGIQTLAQLAELSSAQIADVVPGITATRISKQGWRNQARRLARRKERVKRKTPDSPASRQHYETFAIELLLDEAKEVRRTRVSHAQSGETALWAGWDGARLVNVLVQRAALQLPTQSPAPETAVDNTPPASPASTMAEAPRLKSVEAIVNGSGRAERVIYHDQPFDVRLILALTSPSTSQEISFNYEATVYAKHVGQGSRGQAGKSQGTTRLSEEAALVIPHLTLPPGLYRLGADVKLWPTHPNSAAPVGLGAYLEGGLLQVY